MLLVYIALFKYLKAACEWILGGLWARLICGSFCSRVNISYLGHCVSIEE